MNRYGRTAILREGAEAEYDRLHAEVWPEVLQAVERAGIRNYSIFRHGRLLFSYSELPKKIDFVEVNRALNADPVCGRWEARMKELQQPPTVPVGSSRWVQMKEVFHVV